jgi:hypothetical protein
MYTISYRIRVRRRTALWGGVGITKKIDSDRLFLNFRVDENGEAIRISTLKEGGNSDEFGTLQPGESYTVKLDGLIAVFASIDDPRDTYVDCALICTG